MLLIIRIIKIKILQKVEILHAVFLWTINGMEFLWLFTVILRSRGITCTSPKLLFPLFSVLVLLRFKKFVLIVFL